MLPGGSRITCMILEMFAGLDLYYTDPEQHLTTAGRELDDLDGDLSDLSVRRVDTCIDLAPVPTKWSKYTGFPSEEGIISDVG